MKSLNVAFFTEAGTTRGMGHLVRCYTIYKEFKRHQYNVSFYLDSDINFDYKFNDINYFKWNDLPQIYSFDIVFIDSYEANLEIYNIISNRSKLTVYIDDYGRLDYPKGIIVNFLPDANELFFNTKKTKHKYLLGLDYVPIRRELLNSNKKKDNQLFIMLGGNDILNLSEHLIKYLQKIDLKIVVVINQKNIKEKLSKYKNIKILYKPNDTTLIKYMASSSIAISTTSMGAYELAYLTIPTIIIAIAQNQLEGVKQFLKYQLALYYVSIYQENWLCDIKKYIETIINNDIKLPKIIDEYGVKRIMKETSKLARL